MIRLTIIALFLLTGTGCEGSKPDSEVVTSTQTEQLVKRLREDMELELRDLRGRWLATEGLLTKQRDEIVKLRSALEQSRAHVNSLLALEVEIAALSGALETANKVTSGVQDRTELQRLARSYEEIYCLRKQGAEESVASVYKRHGFDNADAWRKAWEVAARSESFEREVSERVKRLCP